MAFGEVSEVVGEGVEEVGIVAVEAGDEVAFHAVVCGVVVAVVSHPEDVVHHAVVLVVGVAVVVVLGAVVEAPT
ncbi:hypothetical protein CALVIDRAFT_561337 [Calocera viscosa TUFC12733]|uniref:Uncharacterized protein n=1 Tax=Calocera viscosa (strain TUFC12733) TaxID=1330018 RepID=A0A167Q719_CALVF|nr:hypothetical protein CALVIDRAFT_561337 [Calocera viscosa TUFC12733]